jgi:ABC-type branched-subunit amino acid transport system ATPase component
MALLEVSSLKRSFGGIEAVADVSFDVEAGSIHGLIGPNGSGKTTIFNVLSGYYAPSAGEVVFDGRSIGSKPPHEIVAVGIARTFQNLRLFHTLTVRENVQVAAMHAGVPWWRHAVGFPVGWRRSEIVGRREADELLSRVGAAKFADLPIRSLPYGWQRRVELARALACRPRLLMLDEPAAGLNDDETRGLVETVESLRGEGLTILLIEHDMKVVMGTADVVTVLDYGRLVLTGQPNDVATDARVIEAYLGGVPEG